MDRKAMLLATVRRLLQPGEVCLGKGCVGRLAALDGQKAFVVAARSAERTGALASVLSHLQKAGIAVASWCESSAEPTPNRVSALAATANEHQPDWFVALGGGAVIDAAKLAWACYELPDLDVSADKPPAMGPLRNKARFLAIPTTAGAGSEASQAAVLTDAENGRKIPWVSPHWVPDIAILDPAVTVALPMDLTAASGMDALSHAIEAYVSRLATPLIKTLASAAARIILQRLPQVCEQPDNIEARQEMLNAAYLAGLCQSAASTGLAHAMAHSAACILKTHHAPGLAFFLLPAMKMNAALEDSLYDALASDIGFGHGSEMLANLEARFAALPIPQTWQTFAKQPPAREQLAQLAAGAVGDVCMRTNPVRVSEPQITALLEALP